MIFCWILLGRGLTYNLIQQHIVNSIILKKKKIHIGSNIIDPNNMLNI